MPVDEHWIFNDGGRIAAGHKGSARDCVCRAIATVTQLPYNEVYDLINNFAMHERRRAKKRSSARTGVHSATTRKILKHLGWKWHPTMFVGQGGKTHLRATKLPSGPLIVKLSRHITTVIDGIIHDTYDPSRNGMRCVYGY